MYPVFDFSFLCCRVVDCNQAGYCFGIHAVSNPTEFDLLATVRWTEKKKEDEKRGAWRVCRSSILSRINRLYISYEITWSRVGVGKRERESKKIGREKIKKQKKRKKMLRGVERGPKGGSVLCPRHRVRVIGKKRRGRVPRWTGRSLIRPTARRRPHKSTLTDEKGRSLAPLLRVSCSLTWSFFSPLSLLLSTLSLSLSPF